MVGDHLRVLWIRGKIVPLVWIRVMVVQLFGAVRVANVSPTRCTDGMVILLIRRQSSVRPVGVSILQQGDQAVPLQFVTTPKVAPTR